MPQSTEARSPAQPNIQDAFLNFARRERIAVRVHLMDGTDLEARIKNFDRFAVVIEHEGTDLLVFKHAIATIRAPRPMGNYFTHHQP